MALPQTRIVALGDELFDALRARRTLAPLTERVAGIDIDDASNISLHFLHRRPASGEALIGKKIGVTSKPVPEMLGVHPPDFGFLTARMPVTKGHRNSLAGRRQNHPRT